MCVIDGVISVTGGEVQTVIERFPALNEGAVMGIAGGENRHHARRNGEAITQIEAPARFNLLCFFR